MRSRFNYHAFRYAHVTGLDQAPICRGRHGLLHAHQLRPCGRVRVLRRPDEPHLPPGDLDLRMPHAERLRGGLPHPRASRLRRRRRDLARNGPVQLRHRGPLQPLGRQLARCAGSAIGRPAVHRPQLPGPGRRRSHVERLRGDHALAGVPELRRQGRARDQLSDDPEVAGLRRHRRPRTTSWSPTSASASACRSGTTWAIG